MSNRRINYSNNKRVAAIKAEEVSPAVWVAFSQDDDGNVILEKQAPFEPDQVYFSIPRAADEITGLALSTDKIYATFVDDTKFIESFSLTNPLTTFTAAGFPTGVIESPIDVQCDGTYVWVLTAGSTSGQNAKLIRFNLALTVYTVVDLDQSGTEVTDARSFTIDDDGDIWVVTYTDPATLVRVYELSGGGFAYDITEIS